MTQPDHYDQFARFYDDGTSTDNITKVKLLEEIIQKLSPKAESLLEIACGTGNILEPLSKHYKVSGLDLSSKMLSVARTKLPDTPFYEADMTNFELDSRYDVILCIFDSINHLVDFEQWEATFDRVKAHLNGGGVFIVDINTLYKMEQFAAFRPVYSRSKGNYQLINIEKKRDGLYSWNIDMFTPAGEDTYKLSKTSIPISAYPYERVEQALKDRFSLVELSTPDNQPIDDKTNRIYFSCKS
jgi:ubiquinone/menaquinone biosynthesis C-methylase UbiE